MRAAAVLAIIPAHNEASRIAAVIAGLRTRGFPVLVVDDGSTDETAVVANHAGAVVISQANTGKGGAILTGCQWAMHQGLNRVLLCDGDGQHDPADAWRLVAAGAQRHCDLVIGSRRLGQQRQPLLRRLANRCSSLLITFVGGHAFRDSQCGMRVCRPQQVLNLGLRCRAYDLETEWCVRAGRAGQRIRDVPVALIYGDKVSGMRAGRDTARFLSALLQAWRAVR